MAFLNIDIRNEKIGKIITTIAPATLGVYLIHAHASFSRWSWEMLNLQGKLNLPLFPIIQFLVVCGIFTACVVINLIPKNTFGRLENSRFVENICKYISEKLNGVFGGL